ncbi:MAG: DUF2283 domain-containing protein [Candidatus Omnitrophota bacterium]
MSTKEFRIEADNIVSFSIDTLARAIYIKYSNEPIAKTVRKDHSFFIDYDKNRKIVGIELIRLKKAQGVIRQVVKDANKVLSQKIRKEIAPYLKQALSA